MLFKWLFPTDISCLNELGASAWDVGCFKLQLLKHLPCRFTLVCPERVPDEQSPWTCLKESCLDDLTQVVFCRGVVHPGWPCPVVITVISLTPFVLIQRLSGQSSQTAVSSMAKISVKSTCWHLCSARNGIVCWRFLASGHVTLQGQIFRNEESHFWEICTVLAVSNCFVHDGTSYAVLKRVEVEFWCGTCSCDTGTQCSVQR